MSNAVYPSGTTLPGLAWSVSKKPIWKNVIQEAVGGRETRISLNSLPRWQWTLRYEFLRGYTPSGSAFGSAAFTEFQTLANFFNMRQGSWDSFLYTDPNDSVIADTSPSTRQIFGTGNGSRTVWQLLRTMVASGFEEPVYNLNGLAKIYVNDVLQTVAVDYTISGSALVTFTSPPANGAVLTWSGSYYWRVRFVEDALDFSEFARQFWDLRQVSLMSILGS